MTLKVSFNTAVYNFSLFLPDLFLCIQRLKYRHFEFIILDNCSTDNSYQLISEFSETCVQIKCEKNLIT
jgi:glycosyltransferase involved in cell wall biosynthesis